MTGARSWTVVEDDGILVLVHVVGENGLIILLVLNGDGFDDVDQVFNSACHKTSIEIHIFEVLVPCPFLSKGLHEDLPRFGLVIAVP